MPDDTWRAACFNTDRRLYVSPREQEAERRRLEERMNDLDAQDRLERELVGMSTALQKQAERLRLDVPLTEDELRYAAVLAARGETT